MAQGILRFNPDRSLVEAELPDGTEYGPTDFPQDPDGLIVLADADEPDNAFLAVVGHCDGLTTNTMYKLVPIETIIEEDCEFEDDDDEEGSEEETPV